MGLFDLGESSGEAPLPEAPVPDGITRSAIFSPCGLYRYRLDRQWGAARKVLTWVLINPSIASDERDDRTVKRCMGYARAWGYEGIRVVNLFALVSTDPEGLMTASDPVGPDNNLHLIDAAHWAKLYARSENGGGLVVVGWGNSHRSTKAHRAKLGPREEAVLAIFTKYVDVHALTVTADGMPGHPLYLAGNLTPMLYRSRTP